jgi:hypothetical protein
MKPLEEYRKKRRFGRTAEPRPKRKASRAGNLFVVQKHRAAQLHYDFRLEVDQVLKVVVRAEGPLARSVRQAVRDRGRGSSTGLCRLRRRHPRGRVRRRHGDGLGPRHLRARGHRRRRRRPAPRAAQAHVEGPEAQRVVGARANRRAPLAPVQAPRPLRRVEGHRRHRAPLRAQRPNAGADRGRRGGAMSPRRRPGILRKSRAGDEAVDPPDVGHAGIRAVRSTRVGLRGEVRRRPDPRVPAPSAGAFVLAQPQ